MQPNATIEQMLNLSACYFGLRERHFELVSGAAQDAMHATPEQGGSQNPLLHSGH